MKKGNLMLQLLSRRASRRQFVAGSPSLANPAEKLGAAHENLRAAHEKNWP
jgi:hypothetical protein